MKEMRKCVIFGAGERGASIYKKLSIFFEVIAYADNNKSLWGDHKNGVAVIAPDALPELTKSTGASIFIANELHDLDIAEQLDGLGLSYYNCKDYLCCERRDGVWYPVSFGRPDAYKKPDRERLAVLFVQNKPCTRTNKIAQVLKMRGILTCSAYTASPSDAGSQAYVEEFPFWSYGELLDFVNESEFDIVHCSNEPDTLVNLLLHSNKKVIHDCHDIVTMSKKATSSAETAAEYIANTQADGVMYTTERMREILTQKYGTKLDKTLVVGNYPLSSFGRVERLPKRSMLDGELHCVYEGFIVDRALAKNMPYRFFEPVFVRLARLGVHIHIYSSSVPDYLKRLDLEHVCIHYEGNRSGQELIREMTQYDLGLALFPPEALTYPELASANKLTEYLGAGLPVVTNVKSYAKMIESIGCGGMLDLAQEDITQRLHEYSRISVPSDVCDSHGLTMDANAERILNFYKMVIAH